MTFDPYLDPEDYDGEVLCRSCGRHQGECEHDGMCCRHCTHQIDEVAA